MEHKAEIYFEGVSVRSNDFKKEYWITQEEIKDIIEVHNLIDRAIDDINKFYPKTDIDKYAVAKVVFDDISDMLLKSCADKVWWKEDCNKYLFQLVEEFMKHNQSPCKYEIYRQQSLDERRKSL
jgi:hypothetical protein